MKSYNIQDLNVSDATSPDWALAWARFLARETPSNGVFPVFALEDEEWLGLLGLTAKKADGLTYYFPWEAVAFKLLSDSTYATSVNEDGYGSTFRSPEEVAFHVRSFAGGKESLYPSGTLLSVSPRFKARF